ncbi:hypothetical protein CSKR_103166 [Clonorchis sinensis]|uniref:Uncharacterized protein n=1 Tax=Clonorchis sinensis TaxID=79923 RepID=A0A419PNF1_CLOSI|nr:hypothetical protein CSKR_103166 [Clonorchis sinensis]
MVHLANSAAKLFKVSKHPDPYRIFARTIIEYRQLLQRDSANSVTDLTFQETQSGFTRDVLLTCLISSIHRYTGIALDHHSDEIRLDGKVHVGPTAKMPTTT